MKKNRDKEIRFSIDSITDKLCAIEDEREYLSECMGIMIIAQKPVVHIANEKELTEIANAYKMDIAREPYASVSGSVTGYTEQLSIEVNGVRLLSLA